MRRALTLTLVTLAILVGGSGAAYADTITFTETAIASGNLDGTGFTNALLTLTLTGNTTNLLSGLPGDFSIPGMGTVSVAGVGSDTFTDHVRTFVNQNISAAGISDFTTNSLILGTINSAFSSYGLTASIGPLSGSGTHNPPTDLFATIGGAFDISSIGTVTYTAVEGTSTVPEPGSLLLLGTGLAALLGMWKKKTVRQSI